MGEAKPKPLPDIHVDAASLTQTEVTDMDAAPLPDPNTQIEAFMGEAWRRQNIREAWETREAPTKAEREYKIPNARKGETFEGAVRGKYDWGGEEEDPEFTEAYHNDVGAEIMDYASSDGERKFTVYITLEDIDFVSSDAMDITLGDDGRSAKFTVVMPDGKRFFTVPPALLKRPVKSPKIIRQRGKDTVKLKFTKVETRTWGPCFENYHEVYGGKSDAQDLAERTALAKAHAEATKNNPQ